MIKGRFSVEKPFTALLCSLLLLAGAAPVLAAPGATKASWNAGPNGDKNVGFGIYEKEGSCEEFRAPSSLPLRVGTKDVKAGASSGPLQVKDLSFCLLFTDAEPPKSDPEGGTSSCASGSIEFSYDAKTNEYRGKYDFTMKNKMVRRGEFLAQLCKPAQPVKK